VGKEDDMAVERAALREELLTDPEALGYAALVEEGNAGGLADLLNAAGEATVGRGEVTRDRFVRDFFAAMEAIRQLPAGATREKWEWRIQNLLGMKETVNVNDPIMTTLFAELEADGLMSAEQTAALTTRPASRAEALFGAGATVTPIEVSDALRASG
jgi:hypothetical protein